MRGKTLCFFINVDWYFALHWTDRAKAAIKNGYEVHLITQFTDASIKSHIEENGIVCHSIRLRRASLSPISFLSSLRQSFRLIENINPDVLHCITVKPNLLGGLAAKWRQRKVVFSVTGTGLVFSSRTIKARLSKFIVVRLYRQVVNEKSCRVIFENRQDREKFLSLNLGNREVNRVIRGAGVDCERFKYTAPPTGERIAILFAGRMLWDKGVKDLIDACDLLRRRSYDFALNVAGLIDGDTQTGVPEEVILQWHEEGRINWLGSVSDMPSLLSKSNVVVLPSSYGEGVPRVLIEAAASGRPCIATDVVGCRDIVVDGKTGFLIKVGDIEGLADRLERFIKFPELIAGFGRAGRELATEKFRRELVLEKTLGIYSELLDG